MVPPYWRDARLRESPIPVENLGEKSKVEVGLFYVPIVRSSSRVRVSLAWVHL